ncbi:MAG: hypothetical protein WBV82_25915 [Myxococcaceae bacterium]
MAVQLPEYMKKEVAPLLAMMEPLNTQIAVLDAELQRVAETDRRGTTLRIPAISITDSGASRSPVPGLGDRPRA